MKHLAPLLLALPLGALALPQQTITIAETTRHLSVSGAAFSAGLASAVFVNPSIAPYVESAFGVPPATPVRAVAPIQLPHGAKVTKLRAQFYDASSTQSGTLSLRRQNHFDNTVSETLASVSSSGSSGLQTPSDTTISNSIVDNASSTYWLFLDMASPIVGVIQLEAVFIEYTVVEPLP